MRSLAPDASRWRYNPRRSQLGQIPVGRSERVCTAIAANLQAQTAHLLSVTLAVLLRHGVRSSNMVPELTMAMPRKNRQLGLDRPRNSPSIEPLGGPDDIKDVAGRQKVGQNPIRVDHE